MTALPASLAPSDTLTVTLTIQHPGGTTVSGGLYVAKPALGQLVALPGEGLDLVPGDGLVHSLPKAAVGGIVTFHFAWRAPAQPGAVRFEAYGLAANGDGTPNGDYTGSTELDVAFGCTLQEFFPDADGDGYGNSLFVPAAGCSGQPPPGYSGKGGDCADGDPAVHPGAIEICNGKDDDCNGLVDENVLPVAMWPDDDGDGYYAKQTGTPVMGCGDVPGYAAIGGDCAPRDPRIHPGAVEICNGVDDNCDGRVDEGVRPTCGIGFCQRESQTCVVADCLPGRPTPELCNFLDDDCDGVVDDGDLCAAGASCQAGMCVQGGVPPPDTGPRGGTGGSGSGAGGVGLASEGGGGTQGGRGTILPAGSESPPPPGHSASGCSVEPDVRPMDAGAAVGCWSLIFFILVLVLVLVWSSRARNGAPRSSRPGG